MSFPKMPDFFNRLPSFGAQLRDARTLRGLTIEQVAAAASIAPDALRELEAGTRTPPGRDVIAALAAALHLGKRERTTLLEAAEIASPEISSVLGWHRASPAGPPALTAAILVFLIADIRGYTRFTQERGDAAAARLAARFAELARGAAERGDGRLVEVRGDEILAVFASARRALGAAHDLQARYAEEARAHSELPRGIGIGLDVGEAVPVEDGYRGAALNRAARLCSLAGPGEVLVAPGVAYVAPDVEGITYVAHGQEQLKGFDGPTPILLAVPSAALEAGSAAGDDDDTPDGQNG